MSVNYYARTPGTAEGDEGLHIGKSSRSSAEAGTYKTGADVSTWRVFVGQDDDDPEWAHLSAGGLTWEKARAQLAEHLSYFLDGDCSSCAGDAEEGLAKLRALPPNTSFSWIVEGDAYRVQPDAPAANAVPVEELSATEGRALFDEVARRELGMSGPEFVAAWDRGEFDGRDEGPVVKVSMLLPLVRNL